MLETQHASSANGLAFVFVTNFFFGIHNKQQIAIF